jgi:uncharacterized protein YndB with AHSA1/START domain
VTLTDGSFRTLRLAADVNAPAANVIRALTEPLDLVGWLGREAWGLVRPGANLDLVLGPEDLGIEDAIPRTISLHIREARDNFLEVGAAEPRSGRTLNIAFEIEDTGERTHVTVVGSALDPSSAAEPFFRALARATQFHLANLKSVLEEGVDLRETADGELFRFEGTATAAGMRVARADVRLPISAPEAFNAFLDADARRLWWPGSLDLPAFDGLPFESIVEWSGSPRLHLMGTLTRCVEPVSLRLDWTEATPAGALDAAALVAFVGAGSGGGSRVVVVERSAAPLATWAASLGGSLPGWDGLLARFARHARGL